MNKSGRTYRIMIIPERNGKGAFSFQVSSARIIVLFAGVAGVIVVSVFLTYKSIQIARKLNYYKTLQNDNEQLVKENEQLRQLHQKIVHMDSVTTYLEQLATLAPRQTSSRAKTIDSLVISDGTRNTIEPKGPLSFSRQKIPSILPVDGWITQQFTIDTTQGGGAHPGIDIAAPAGMIIKASASGTVLAVLQDADYGTMVVLQHEDGFITRYGHCEIAIVSVNDKVDRGQTIALVGNTGRSSAPHLHYEVIKNGKNDDPQHYLSSPRKTEN